MIAICIWKIKSMFRDRIFMDTSAGYAIIDKNDRDQRKEPGEYFSNMKIKDLVLRIVPPLPWWSALWLIPFSLLMTILFNMEDLNLFSHRGHREHRDIRAEPEKEFNPANSINFVQAFAFPLLNLNPSVASVTSVANKFLIFFLLIYFLFWLNCSENLWFCECFNLIVRKLLFGHGWIQIIRINEKENNYLWLSAKICVLLNLRRNFYQDADSPC